MTLQVTSTVRLLFFAGVRSADAVRRYFIRKNSATAATTSVTDPVIPTRQRKRRSTWEAVLEACSGENWI
jgi:hypothetical protein